jgi:SAM-dependent methyltransferase
MNFIYKCYLQRIFSSIPKGERLNYFFQKHITQTLPVSDEGFIKRLAIAKEHFDTFNKYTQSAGNQDTTCYEFGAGWDLINPIGLSLLGIQTLHCIDIRELAFPELINDTISKLYKLKRQIPFDYSLPERMPLITTCNFKHILMTYFGINYKAPVDARCTGIQEAVMDLIVSNLTLEHIPKNDISKILQECYRILKKDGIVSCFIDYTDHWSHFDNSISIYNFLKYSHSEWQRFNPPLHYQNRLRHRDYFDIISQMGFEVLEDKPMAPTEEEVDSLRDMEIDAYFLNKYTLEELAIKGAKIVLKK